MSAPSREDVLARLDAARKATPGPWAWHEGPGEQFAEVRSPVNGKLIACDVDDEDAEHIAFNDPEFVASAMQALLSLMEENSDLRAEISASRSVAQTYSDVVEQARALVAQARHEPNCATVYEPEYDCDCQKARLARVLDAAPAAPVSGFPVDAITIVKYGTPVAPRPTHDEIAREVARHRATPVPATAGGIGRLCCVCDGVWRTFADHESHLADVVARLLEGLDASPSASGPGIQVHKIDGGAA